jgi:hypothetical protein
MEVPGPARPSRAPAARVRESALKPPVPSIEYHTIRWSEIRLPHPERNGEYVKLRIDGPFALRSYYRVDGSARTIELDLTRRRADGTLAACLVCGHASFAVRRALPWAWLLLWLALGLGGAYWTFGLSLLVAAYPVWFLVAQAPRIERCAACGAEYVDFRRGPRV